MCEMRWQPWGEGCGVGPTGMRTRHADINCVHAAPLSASCYRLQDRHGRSAAWTVEDSGTTEKTVQKWSGCSYGKYPRSSRAASLPIHVSYFSRPFCSSLLDKYWGKARSGNRANRPLSATLTGWLAKLIQGARRRRVTRFVKWGIMYCGYLILLVYMLHVLCILGISRYSWL